MAVVDPKICDPPKRDSRDVGGAERVGRTKVRLFFNCREPLGTAPCRTAASLWFPDLRALSPFRAAARAFAQHLPSSPIWLASSSTSRALRASLSSSLRPRWASINQGIRRRPAGRSRGARGVQQGRSGSSHQAPAETGPGARPRPGVRPQRPVRTKRGRLGRRSVRPAALRQATSCFVGPDQSRSCLGRA